MHASNPLSLETNNVWVTASIFNIPTSFFTSKVLKSVYFKDTEKEISLDEIAVNRDDYDWMKDLKQKVGQGKHIHFKTDKGDIITINKSKKTIGFKEFMRVLRDLEC